MSIMEEQKTEEQDAAADEQMMEQISRESYQAVAEICDTAHLKPGALFVVGCSSSEVLGERIGTATNVDVAGHIYDGVQKALSERDIYLAAQCCEHLNRALVVERKVMERWDLEQVNAIPQPNHAGGAFATVAYQRLTDPVLVEDLRAKADAGIDIGGTLIGMHIHPVVVPMRISLRKIGQAPIICARHRVKYTGGIRAIYDEQLL